MPVNIIFAYAHSITQCYRQRSAWKVFFLSLWKYGRFNCDSTAPTIDESQWKENGPLCFVFSGVHFTEQSIAWEALLQSLQLLSLPWSHDVLLPHIVTLQLWRKKKTQRRNKRDKSNTMMHALQLLQLVKRHISGWSDENQWWNQACSLSHSELRLSQGINQSIRKF